MISYARAKINIGLNITGRREDGYHTLETVFYPFPYYDIMEIMPTNRGEASLEITGLNLPVTADNLCLRAYELLKADFDIPAVHIHLHKQIPFGAGLGGGSSDASEVLKALNTSFDLGLSKDELAAYAAKLGSDCPFFIYDRPLYAEGTGGDFKEVDIDLSDKFIALVKPDLHISTAEAYAGVLPQAPEANLRDLVKLPMQEWKYHIRNDFEEGIFTLYPNIRSLKSAFYEQGAVYASMSGSGSAVFGIFDERVDLSALAEFGQVFYPVEL